MEPNKVAKTALELLTNDFDREEPFLNTIWGPFIGGILGFGAAIAINVGSRRPMFSGIQKHILYPIVAGTGCHFLYKWRNEYYAEKDAVLRYYVQMHPEDFPMPERQKYRDILLPWVPIR